MTLKIDEKWLLYFKAGLNAGQINCKLDGEYEPNKAWWSSTLSLDETRKTPEQIFKEGYALGWKHAWTIPIGRGRLNWLETNEYINIKRR